MSAQFGRWNFDGRPVDTQYLNEVAGLLSHTGLTARSPGSRATSAFCIVLFTPRRYLCRESQPLVTQSGDVITWDGLLDNRDELTNDSVWPIAMTAQTSRLLGLPGHDGVPTFLRSSSAIGH